MFLSFFFLSLFLSGNYSINTIEQGVCVSAAAQGIANSSFAGTDTFVPYDAPSILDGIGIFQPCNNQIISKINPKICNCDGSLPEQVWGRKIQYRDPCGLEKKAGDQQVWIAAPIVGSVVVAIGVGILIYYVRKRKNAKLERGIEEIALHDIDSQPTVSDGSVQSFDSGVAIINHQAGPSTKPI